MRALFVLVVVSYLLHTLVAETNLIRKNGYCMWYGQCGKSPTTGKPINCFYNGKAKPIDREESHQILFQLCPELVLQNRNVCCDYNQLSALLSGIQAAQQMMTRCPACWKNFRQLYCQMTCSPDNSLFINASHVVLANNGSEAITAIDYFVDPLFRDGLYNSCKNVLFPSNNKKIMSFLCGSNGAQNCSALKFLRYMGDPALNNVSPFKIGYPGNTSAPNITAMNVTIKTCNETVYEPYTNKTSDPCSCQDCVISCTPLPPYVPEKHWELDIGDIHFNLISFVTLLIYLVFLIVFIAGSILYFNRGANRQQLNYDHSHHRARIDQQMTLGTLAVMGKKMEDGIKYYFTKWGIFCCNNAWLVIFLSHVFAVTCGHGLIKFTVVTDPVKLWSAPGSQARTEKDTFDKNFSPFYRTAQIIFSVKPSSPKSNMSCYHNFYGTSCKLTGPILRKEFLFKVCLRSSL